MKTDLPTYEEVLEMLSVKAREGSVSAMIALERALRRETPESDEVDDVDEIIERILAKRADED
jgi:tRNA C32,U32 (ribose-2'-O)-methylase TrmJ